MGKYPKAMKEKQKENKLAQRTVDRPRGEVRKARAEREAQAEAAQENGKQLRLTRREQERRERAEARAAAEPARRAARQAEHAKLLEQHAKFKKERDELVAHIKAQLIAKKLGETGQLNKIDEGLADAPKAEGDTTT